MALGVKRLWGHDRGIEGSRLRENDENGKLIQDGLMWQHQRKTYAITVMTLTFAAVFLATGISLIAIIISQSFNALLVFIFFVILFLLNIDIMGKLSQSQSGIIFKTDDTIWYSKPHGAWSYAPFYPEWKQLPFKVSSIVSIEKTRSWIAVYFDNGDDFPFGFDSDERNGRIMVVQLTQALNAVREAMNPIRFGD